MSGFSPAQMEVEIERLRADLLSISASYSALEILARNEAARLSFLDEILSSHQTADLFGIDRAHCHSIRDAIDFMMKNQ